MFENGKKIFETKITNDHGPYGQQNIEKLVFYQNGKFVSDRLSNDS